jgi:hypothetical protein
MTVERDGSTIATAAAAAGRAPPGRRSHHRGRRRPAAPEELGAFDHYLTARWQLYTTLGRCWPLHPRARAVAAAPGGGPGAGLQPGHRRRPPTPRGGPGGALVAGGADPDQRPTPAPAELTGTSPGPPVGRLAAMDPIVDLLSRPPRPASTSTTTSAGPGNLTADCTRRSGSRPTTASSPAPRAPPGATGCPALLEIPPFRAAGSGAGRRGVLDPLRQARRERIGR